MREIKGKYYSDIKGRLKKVYDQLIIREAVHLLVINVTYFLGWLFAAIMLEYFFDFSQEVRTVIFYGSLIYLIIAAFIVLFPTTRIFRKISLKQLFDTAGIIGSYFSEIKDDLLNALQLLNEEKHNYSDDLIEASFNTVVRKSAKVKFTDVVNYGEVSSQAKRLVLLLVPFLAFYIISSDFENAGYRIWQFNQNFVQPPKISFVITPGDISLTKGEPLNISITIIGEPESSVEMNIKNIDQTSFSSRRVNNTKDNQFTFTLNSVTNSLHYYVSVDEFRSDEYFVEVINRPFVKGIKLNVTPPVYSGMDQIFQLDNGSITALKGSKVKFELTASKRLSKAKMHFTESVQNLLTGGNKASGTFQIMKDDKYFISLVDTENITSENPVEYSINLIEDNFPIIDLRKPEDNYKVTTDRIVIEASIRDDFGFSNCTLNYRLSASRYSNITESFEKINMLVEKRELEQDIIYVWNISNLFLAEGDVVSYYLEVYDNDTVSGPKSARSEVRRIKVPSIDEFFDEADEVQDYVKEELTKTMDEAEELSKELEKLSNELKKNKKEITWEEKEKLESALNKFEEMSKKVSEVAEKMSEMQKNMAEKDLLSEETMEKYMELQNLMKQLEGSEALEAMKKMQQELQNLMRNQAQQNLDKMKMNENAFKESLERTLNLMKRIQLDQKVEELIKRTENLSEKLSEMSEKLKNEKENSESMENRSEDIKKELENIEEAMKELEEKMKDVPQMPLQEMNKIESEFSNQNNKELSDKISSQIKSSQSKNAQTSSMEMKENMDKIGEMFEKMQENMNNEMQMEMFYDFVKVLNDLIYVSKEQEKLKNTTEQFPNGSQQVKDMADDQVKVSNNLNRILERVNKMSQKSFAITPEMGKSIGDAINSMDLAKTYLQNGIKANGIRNETEAMKSLNDAAIQMKSAMNQMMNGGGSGGGMSSLMQQLKQMAEQQMDLNQMTKMLQQERMAQQQMAQMQRMASEQEAIRKSLAELNREAEESGQSKKLTADLEKIMEEMQEVVKNMSSNNYDDNLIQKQEHILSRLLEAQRSVNDRDFDKERESSSGNQISREGPGSLNVSDKMKTDLIREELLRALKEGYKKDYQELIRRYFEAIEKELIN